MKIGIDCRLWSESGVGRYIRNLVEQLQIIDRKNDYVLFVLNKDGYEILKRVQNDSFRIVKADIRWHTLEEQLKFPQIINKENLDLMHFPYISVPIFYNKPFIVTIHDLILYHFPTGEASTLPLPLYRLKLLGYKLVISQAAKKAKKIITVSQATKEEIMDHLGVDLDKVVVTYEGVFANSKLKTQNSKLLASLKLWRSGQLKTKNFFLYVGNVYPHKNLDRLLDAFNSVILERGNRISSNKVDPIGQTASRMTNDLCLIFVGKQDYFYKRLKEKVKNMGLEKSVMFYGEETDEELQGLYKNALALIMPSLMEGFSLPALEAMANKCLVLASDISALREICGDCAVYFDRYNVEDITQTMKSIHSNDINHYSENIRKGFERSKMFSWEKMTKETLKIYESCVGLR